MTLQSTSGNPYAAGAVSSSQIDGLPPLVDETISGQSQTKTVPPSSNPPIVIDHEPLTTTDVEVRSTPEVSLEPALSVPLARSPQLSPLTSPVPFARYSASDEPTHLEGISSADSTDHAVEHTEESPLRAGRYSVFNVALAIFIVANLLMSFSPPIEFDKFKFPYQGWAWWTFNDLRTSSEEHNVALLGSSLMVSAVNNSDAMYTQKELNLASYHKAVYLDKLLSEKFGGTFRTYDLAAPGQMPSDAYMTLHAMLKTHQRPDVVVYGVAPRDFYDSSMSSPVDTEPFKFLHRLVNLDDSWNKLFKSPFDKLNFILEREVYLYGNALDFSMVASEKLETFLNKYAPPPIGRGLFTYWDRVKLLPAYKAGEIHPLAVRITPQNPAEPPTFSDNTPEYKERYKNPDPKNYDIQHYFLVKLVELCKRERIELLVVNMPITLDNIRVLGSYKYMGYVHSLRKLAKDYKVHAFDLNDFALYTHNDYADGVHLNAFGGTKLFKQLVGIMGGTYSTSLALEASGHHMERRKGIAGEHPPDNFNTDLPL